MKCFVCSDIHMACDNLERLFQKAGPCEAVLFAGDLTNWGSKADAEKVLACFKEKPVYAIPGNLDTLAVMEIFEDQSELAHGCVKKLVDWEVIGFGGGSLKNPGDILFGEEAILETLEPLLKKSIGAKTILITHQPPYNTKLDSVRGNHVGSQAVRTLIEKYQPAFHFCGHIHESWSEDLVGKTRCYNVAAVKEGRAAGFDLETGFFQRIGLKGGGDVD